MFYNCDSTYYRNDGSYHSHLYVSNDPNAKCPSPSCWSNMNKPMAYVKSTAKGTFKVKKASGYVKGLETNMVMDNLIVKPMSTIPNALCSALLRLKTWEPPETVEVVKLCKHHKRKSSIKHF